MKATAITLQLLTMVLATWGAFGQSDEAHLEALSTLESSGSASGSFKTAGISGYSKTTETSGSTKSVSGVSDSGLTKAHVTLDGEISRKTKLSLQSPGSQLQLLPAYFSQTFDSLGDQTRHVKLLFQSTGKDASSGEITRKSLLEIVGESGASSFVGAVEYPLREPGSGVVPRFVQSPGLDEVARFLQVDRAALVESAERDFDGFERGQASGSMCAKCGLRTEVLSEDQIVHKYSLRIGVLNMRLNQVLQQVKRASGQARLDALAELQSLKAELAEAERLKLERELEIEQENHEKRQQAEAALRAKVETEVWAKMAALEKLSAAQWRQKLESTDATFGELERTWAQEKTRALAEQQNYEAAQARVAELEEKISNLRDGVLDTAQNARKARDSIALLEQTLADELAQKNDLTLKNSALSKTLAELKAKVEAQSVEFASLTEARAILKAEVQTLTDRVESARLNTAEVQSQIADLKTHRAQTEQALRSETDAKVEAAADLESLHKQIQDHQKAAASSLVDHRSSQDKVKLATLKLERLKRKVTQAVQKTKAAKQRLAQLTKTLSKLTQKQDAEELKRKSLRKRIIKMRKQFCKATGSAESSLNLVKSGASAKTDDLHSHPSESNSEEIKPQLDLDLDMELDLNDHSFDLDTRGHGISRETVKASQILDNTDMFLSGRHRQQQLDQIAALDRKAGRIGSFLIGSAKPKAGDKLSATGAGSASEREASGLKRNRSFKRNWRQKNLELPSFFN